MNPAASNLANRRAVQCKKFYRQKRVGNRGSCRRVGLVFAKLMLSKANYLTGADEAILDWWV